jgi:regulator of sirC expression with transglutaminase-like and TPR domain
MELSVDWGEPPPDNENAAAFAALMREPDERLPLDRAEALLARGVAYRQLDVQEILDQLDVLAAGLHARLPRDRTPLAAVTALCDYLGRDLGFRAPQGGEDDYYDPRNSFLNDVLGRRIGIPIGLSLVYLEVARRVDIPLVGVGLPWHFVVKHPLGDDPHDAIFLDPFAGGALLTPAELRARFEAQAQGRVPYAEHFLGAVTKKQVLTRTLHNLRGIYVARNNVRSLMHVLDYLLLIAPWDLETRRERGLLALRIGEADRALADLQVYAEYVQDDPNLPLINSYIEALRRRFTLGG